MRWGPALFWFAAACMLHTLIDIPLHYDDGPLVFYPLNWQARFYSPVSYWDPRRYGIPVAIMEHLMVLGMGISGDGSGGAGGDAGRAVD